MIENKSRLFRIHSSREIILFGLLYGARKKTVSQNYQMCREFSWKLYGNFTWRKVKLIKTFPVGWLNEGKQVNLMLINRQL